MEYIDRINAIIGENEKEIVLINETTIKPEESKMINCDYCMYFF